MGRIYLDYQATTPVDPRVLEAMLPYFREKFGNAASRNHTFGAEAAEAVEKAREQVASLIHADPKELVLTSGATESNNLAIQGAVRFYREKGDHVITVATEHYAVLKTVQMLEQQGLAKATILRVRKDGLIDLDELRQAITPRTVLVSVMAVNNEIGVIQPISEIGRICREKGVLFHTDAAQAAGKIPIDVETMNIDLLSLTAHKMYGPKGVGALYVRKRNPRVRLQPIFGGGGHENGLRSGTLAVPLIVGLGAACAIDEREGETEGRRILALRERLRKGIFGSLDHVHVNGSLEHRLPGNLNLSFGYVEGGALLQSMPEVAVSAASACTTATIEVSHVLKALGVTEDLIHNTIRFGIGRFTTDAEIDEVLARLIPAVREQRKKSPLYPSAVGNSKGTGGREFV